MQDTDAISGEFWDCSYQKGDIWGQRWHLTDWQVNPEHADAAPLSQCSQLSSWSVTAVLTGQLCAETGSYHTFRVHREETLLLRSSYNTAENIYTGLWTSCIIFLVLLKLSSLWHMHRTTIALQQECAKSSVFPQSDFLHFFFFFYFFLIQINFINLKKEVAFILIVSHPFLILSIKKMHYENSHCQLENCLIWALTQPSLLRVETPVTSPA